ncbi:CpaB family protein [Tatumella citrea]|uniref:Flp pilus assembly protein CpaB n=1 Tax=Tatumella citrea TaxID=53336 RepID=A0A1Y0L539_TATCI|nr:hypothetical protein [Tatumella citrea]ARU93154.1 hypothetical protein A7K98_04700 [Tatumella citrea]ARU97193.1 hypothetical protein A7K99_04700 [Tatumella citrea]
MNQRLLVILAVLLLIVGGVGLLMSNGTPTPESVTPQAAFRQVNYFISEKVLPAGSLLRDEDFAMKSESLPAEGPEVAEITADSLRGMFLLTDKKPGDRILVSNVSPDDPKNKLAAANMTRYKTVINEPFTGAIHQLRPGDYVDVYLRFVTENPPARSKRSEGVLQGDSSLNFFRIFEARRVISYPGKAVETLLDRQPLLESSDKNKVTGNLSLDLELSSGDLKRLYRVTRKYEVILFPTGQDKAKRKTLSATQGTAQ